MAACQSHIAVVHMWAPYCCRCYPGLHGCLPTPHSWCTLWAPIAAVANIPYMAALPIPHSCCTHVGSIAVVHMWAPYHCCCSCHSYMATYLSHIAGVPCGLPLLLAPIAICIAACITYPT